MLDITPLPVISGFLGASMVKNLPPVQDSQETQVWFLVQEDPLEEGMAPHSIILAWRIPWTEDPGGLQFIGLQWVGYNWVAEHTHSTATNLRFWSKKSRPGGTGWGRSQRLTGMERGRCGCHCWKALISGCVFWPFLHLQSPVLCDPSRDSPHSCFLLTTHFFFPSAHLPWPENGCANSWQFNKNDVLWGQGSCPFLPGQKLQFIKAGSYEGWRVIVSVVLENRCLHEEQDRKQKAECGNGKGQNPGNGRGKESL